MNDSSPVLGKIPVKRALQGLAVLYLPPLLLILWVVASLVAGVSGRLSQTPTTSYRRWVRRLLGLGNIVPGLYVFWLRPWFLRWGATTEETRKPLPGDEFVPDPLYQSTRGVTIHAPVDQVWRWLAQIGQDRGGFYSHEWLENLAGASMCNADRVHPEWQQRAIGDRVQLSPDVGLPVLAFIRNHALVLKGWGAFVLEPIDTQTTRLLIRNRVPRDGGALLSALLIEIPHFIMERGMMLGLKARAESTAYRSPVAGPG